MKNKVFCRICKEQKSVDNFTPIKGTKRYRTVCHKCRREVEYPKRKDDACRIARQYYKDHKEEVKARVKANRAKNLPAEMLKTAKYRAEKHGWDFNIDAEDIVIPNVCPVLNIPLVIGEGHPTPNSPSLDRIDPTKGYIKGNVMVISHKANTIKSNATPEELRKVADFYENALTKERPPHNRGGLSFV